MGAVLTTEPVQYMLTDQGFVPGQGLGKNLQGDPQILAVTWTVCRVGKFFLGVIAEQPESISIKWKTEKSV